MQFNLNFSSSKRPISIHQDPSKRNAPPIIPFSNTYRNMNIRSEMDRQRVAPPPLPQEKPKTMKWGQPTWFLLHTLAEKVKEDQFPRIRKELLDVILKICNNLPCPDCANHATQYLNGINFNTITTKTTLKDMIYHFHNTVNKKKGFAQFNYLDLTDKYSKANTVNIIQNFMYFYEQKSYGMRVGTTSFYRSNVTANLKQWFMNNIQCFDP